MPILQIVSVTQKLAEKCFIIVGTKLFFVGEQIGDVFVEGVSQMVAERSEI